MTVPVPLGVRIYNNRGKAFDVWVTRWVDDISFRSVVPGGFASATITLHNDPDQPFRQLAQLFNRVQIVDLRSAEIAWEGRVDTARRDTAADTWELGCLGAMVVASDIRRPMFYIDSSIASWLPSGIGFTEQFATQTSEDIKTIKLGVNGTIYFGAWPSGFTHQMCETCDVRLGRFDLTLQGSGSSANLGNFRTAIHVTDGGGANQQSNVELQAWNAASVRRSNLVGAVGSFTSTLAQRIYIGVDMTASTTVAAGVAEGRIVNPLVQVQLVDETGAKLTTAASYPNAYMTVPQVVRDVVGRFLVGAWLTSTNNVPYAGQVRPDDIYIDTTSTAQITHLTYFDGATAADILNDLMTAQSNAYWAIWESKYGATDGVNGQSDWGYRFEWATWPASWGYQATSIDGLEEQPDGGNLYNYVFYQYPTNSPNFDSAFSYLQNYWATSNENQLLTDARLVRATTIKGEEPQSSTVAFDRAKALHGELKRTVNAGTLTVKRPIHLYDPGANSWSGASQMCDPWMIRPGKLIRIVDIPPRANSNTFNNGTSAFTPELDGTVLRVVSTTYNSGDNSCVLELDQVPAWDTATQIVDAAKGSSNLVVRG